VAVSTVVKVWLAEPSFRNFAQEKYKPNSIKNAQYHQVLIGFGHGEAIVVLLYIYYGAEDACGERAENEAPDYRGSHYLWVDH
jgi:hypothetical protein